MSNVEQYEMIDFNNSETRLTQDTRDEARNRPTRFETNRGPFSQD